MRFCQIKKCQPNYKQDSPISLPSRARNLLPLGKRSRLFISHAYSFFSNFLGRGEYRNRLTKDQMSEPYSRIVFMQLVLVFGGGLSMILGQTELILIIVIGLKIYFDVKAHIKEHAQGHKDR